MIRKQSVEKNQSNRTLMILFLEKELRHITKPILNVCESNDFIGTTMTVLNSASLDLSKDAGSEHKHRQVQGEQFVSVCNMTTTYTEKTMVLRSNNFTTTTST